MKKIKHSSVEDLEIINSVDNPSVRSTDPSSWKCLSDEQRDIINTWYVTHLAHEEKYNEREKNIIINSGYFAISPFAFGYALIKNPKMDWHLIVEAICAWIVYSLIFYSASFLYSNFFSSKSDIGKYENVLFHVVAVLIACFVTFFVLDRIGII